ncbi:mersacidin/lichenicidin family type 2 lantibiotic [Micromonospora sp. DT231]|uniref:mersacidin/lichenicidin family type 2 lantibiotic n=1 Tax=Micromonospora sp. DT231 TaxID=3416526 RepID=UPI003CF9D9AE
MDTAARAWKDPVFRATLDDSELATLPAHPVGRVELGEMVMDGSRGAGSESTATMGCCNGEPYTYRTCLTCYPLWTCRTCWGC